MTKLSPSVPESSGFRAAHSIRFVRGDTAEDPPRLLLCDGLGKYAPVASVCAAAGMQALHTQAAFPGRDIALV